MKIGEFVTKLKTTKHTVRHYEELELLTPEWDGPYKSYGDKEILDFQVIGELKEMGFNLKEVQMLFQMKKAYGCGDKKLIHQTIEHLTKHVKVLQEKEEELRFKRKQLQEEIEKMKVLT